MTVLLAACGAKTQPATTVPETTVPTVDNTQVKTEIAVENPTSASKETINPVEKAPTPAPVQAPAKKSYTAADVATHSNASSCWLILDAKVYDVTKFIPSHPGGEAILKGCGKDATQMFSRHPASAKAMKEQFYIGDLKS